MKTERKTNVDTEEVQQSKDAVKEKFAADIKEDQDKSKPYSHWKRRAYISWALIGIGLVIAGIIYIFGVLWQALATIVIAAFITFLLHVPVDMMERKKIPRVVGTSICFVVLVGILAVLVISVLPTLTTETGKFIASVPDYADQAHQFFENISSYGALGLSSGQISTAIDAISTWLSDQGAGIMGDMASGVIGGVMDLGTGAMIVFIALICAFWILIDLPKIISEIRSLIPESRLDDYAILSDAIGTAFYGWMKSTLICAIATGIATLIVAIGAGIPYAALVALLCGLLYIIPYIGPVIAAVLAGLVGLLVSPVVSVIMIISVIIIINVIANLLAPKLMKNSVNLHPALVMIVIMIGGALLGVWGMLLSIPVAAACQSVFITYFEAKTGREIASKDGALFRESESS